MTMSASDYRLSHADPQKGASYDRDFRESRFLSFLWRREQAVLDEVIRGRLAARQLKCLDFACGTGRITEYLARRGARVTGVDVSASMLDEARSRKVDADFVEADLTQEDPLGDRTFDLVTAFRFFPNAQNSLRVAAIGAMARHLADDGILVFNNHINASSLMCRIWRALGKPMPFRPMTYAEAAALIGAAGFELLDCYALGVVPATARRMLVPESAHLAIDAVANRLHIGRVLAQDLLFVCRKRRVVTD